MRDGSWEKQICAPPLGQALGKEADGPRQPGKPQSLCPAARAAERWGVCFARYSDGCAAAE